MRNRLIGLVVTLIVSRVAAQDTRIDHFGAHWMRIATPCERFRPADAVTLDMRLTDLKKQLPDSSSDRFLREYACVESLAYLRDARATSQGGMQSHHAGAAVGALLTLLSRRSNDSVSAESLAGIALDMITGPVLRTAYQTVGAAPTGPGLSDAIERRQAIADGLYRAVQSGLEMPVLLRACVEFQLAVGDVATGRYCIDRGLSQGQDASWYRVRLSWLGWLRRDAEAAAAYMDSAVVHARDAASRAEVAWHVQGMIPGDSGRADRIESIWAGMQDEARVAWLHSHATNKTHDDFITLVMSAESRPNFLNNLTWACPVWAEHNGYREPSVSFHCNSPTGNREAMVEMTGNIFRLWNPVTGIPIGLFTFGVDRHDVDITASGTTRAVQVNLNLRQRDFLSGAWTDTTVEKHALDASAGKDMIGGFLVLPPPDGPSSWSLTVRQAGRYGRVSFDGSNSLGDGSLVLSDLVPGVSSQALTWRFGEDTVVLAPTNTISVKEPMQVFFQLHNTKERSDARMVLQLRQIVRGEILAVPALSLKFTTTAYVGITGVQKELVLSRIEKGDYALEVQILDEHGAVLATRTTNVFLR